MREIALSLLLSCLAVVGAYNQNSQPESSTYKAAVVEFYPNTSLSLYDFVSTSQDKYLEFISDAGHQDVDIIIFPEATLNRVWNDPASGHSLAVEVPHQKEKANPCAHPEKYAKLMVSLSCAASFEGLYIVVNVAEIEYSSDEKYMLFNTNVVFDRNGTVISRYRKINLYGENMFTPSLDKELGVFETDFGVKFGHFICFDILFQQPAVQIVENGDITNIIYTTMWFSELPFLTAIELQEGYARAHNINFLAAGANNPHLGSSGSGIYSGKTGALTSYISGEEGNKMLVATLPKIPAKDFNANFLTPSYTQKTKKTTSDLDKLHVEHDKLAVYKTEIIDHNLDQQFINLTYGDVECQFDIKINKHYDSQNKMGSDVYVYRAVAFNGVRSFTYQTGGMANCAVVACTNNTISTCGTRFPSHSTVRQTFEITSIKITATVPKPELDEKMKCHNIVYHPITVDMSLLTFSLNDYEYTISEIKDSDRFVKLIMNLKAPKADMLTFGFMGRVFNKDNTPVTGNTNVVKSDKLVVFLCFINYVLFYFSRN